MEDLSVGASQEPEKPKKIRNPRVSSVDWLAARRRFIEADEKMSYQSLADEVGVSRERLNEVANNEGWAMLRAQRLDTKLRESDAQLAILQAAKTDGVLMRKFSNVAAQMLDQIQEVLSSSEGKKEKAKGTRMNALNTASFALGNIARALKEVGVVGLPKQLKEAAGEANGRWNPQMLTALNVTVQNLMADQRPATAAGTPAAAQPVVDVEADEDDPDVV